VRIGIDIRFLHRGLTHVPGQKMLGGIGGYFYHLLLNLLHQDKENHYVLLVDASCGKDPLVELFGQHPKVEFVPLPPQFHLPLVDAGLGEWVRRLQEQWRIAPVISKLRMDVLHVSTFVLSGLNGSGNRIPQVATVYHLSLDQLPPDTGAGDAGRGGGLKMRLRWGASWEYWRRLRELQGAERVIAISQNTKRDLVRYAGVEAARVEVIYCGVDRRVFHPRDERKCLPVLRRYGLRQPYALYVGSLFANKNIDRLLLAFREVRGKVPGLRLVLTGLISRFYKQEYVKMRLRLEQLGIADGVDLLGFVPEEDLAAIYCGAQFLVHPSLYEGFGLTVLEAMACGVPVVCSDRGSLPEVGGEAVVYVEAEDVGSIASGMLRLCEDEELRRMCRMRGLERAGLFSWGEMARRTLRVYQEVGG